MGTFQNPRLRLRIETFPIVRLVLDLRDLEVPLPRRAGLLLEKLLTERVAEKGARDLLVVVGLLVVMRESDFDELDEEFVQLG